MGEEDESKIDVARLLVGLGFRVFPLIEGTKIPAQEGAFVTWAAKNENEVDSLWTDPLLQIPLAFDIGIATESYKDNESLVVIDFDLDAAKNIDGEKEAALLGYEFPPTFSVQTKRGGKHLYYRWTEPVPQRAAGFLGRGIDVRARGGFVKWHGDTAPVMVDIALCPGWIIDRLQSAAEFPSQNTQVGKIETDPARAIAAIQATELTEGMRNAGVYELACRLKNYGYPLDVTLSLINEHLEWAGLEWAELEITTRSAYRTSRSGFGVLNPKNDFEPINPDASDPVLKYNIDYAYHVTDSGKDAVIQLETGKPLLVQTFHNLNLSDSYEDPKTKKRAYRSRLWMAHPKRRQVSRIDFRPGEEERDGELNLWRGFSVEPLGVGEEPTPIMRESLGMFFEHLINNVCGKDPFQTSWLTSYFAHLFQFPGEKPLVAPVFRGKKGVGKDTLIDRIGELVSANYVMATDPRHFVGNFNSHLEKCLLLVLNEAFWSGDKRAEGTLKNLITGKNIIIERKFGEARPVKNSFRICVMGNEDWLIPAGFDERRFTVFDVGEDRRLDTKFFSAMRKTMELGGYRYLLRYFLDYKIEADLSLPLGTQGLQRQKLESLSLLQEWWRECLLDEKIGEVRFGEEPTFVTSQTVSEAIKFFFRTFNSKSRYPVTRQISDFLKDICGATSSRTYLGPNRVRGFLVPALTECRKKWVAVTGIEESWI